MWPTRALPSTAITPPLNCRYPKNAPRRSVGFALPTIPMKASADAPRGIEKTEYVNGKTARAREVLRLSITKTETTSSDQHRARNTAIAR